MPGSKARLFTPISVDAPDDLLPADHFCRFVDRAQHPSFMCKLVRQTYADADRPSVDPVTFFKLQLAKFFEGIRSNRQCLAGDRLSAR
jgi:hypothetical protein